MGQSDNGDEREILRTNLRRFAESEVAPHLDAFNHDPAQMLPERVVLKMRKLGLFRMLIDSDLEGGGDLLILSSALQTLAETAAAPATILFAHTMAQQLLFKAATQNDGPDGKRSEELLGYPIYTEPTAGDGGMTCRYDSDGSALLLDGTCELVVNAPIADRLVLPVTLTGAEGGLVLVALKRDTAGVEIGEPLLMLGMRGCPVADVAAVGARIDKRQVIATPPDAAELVRVIARRFFGPASAISAGILGCSIRTATDYARERHQGGCKIIEHQRVRCILSDMVTEHVVCQQAVQQLSRSEVNDGSAKATLFIHAKEGAARATCDGVQLLGGYGYMEDYAQERCMRDAKQAECLLGRCGVLRQELMTEWLDAGASLSRE